MAADCIDAASIDATIDSSSILCGVSAPLAPDRPPDLPAPAPLLAPHDAATYAEWFACLAEPTRVRLLHAVAVAGREVTVGELTEQLGISQSTCSHHLRKLADVGFVHLRKEGTATLVSVNPACCTGLPHAADAVMGMLGPAPVLPRPTCPPTSPSAPWSPPTGPTCAASTPRASPPGTPPSRPRSPTAAPWTTPGCPTTAGSPRSTARSSAGPPPTPVSTATASTPGSPRPRSTSATGHRGRGVGKALIHRQVTAADDAGLWTLQTSIFPENRASIALHQSAGFRTLGVRERIGRHHGVWRDTVFLERRRTDDA